MTLFAAPCSQTNTIFGGAVFDSCWARRAVAPSSGTRIERMDRRSMEKFYQVRKAVLSALTVVASPLEEIIRLKIPTAPFVAARTRNLRTVEFLSRYCPLKN